MTRLSLSMALLAMYLAFTASGCACAGAVGHFTLRTDGKAPAQILPDFRPVAGPILHLRSDGASTATAEYNVAGLQIPYRVSWWVYAGTMGYDDFVVCQARDEQGKQTDVTVMFGEHPDKIPASPDDWHGMVWIVDAEGRRSVAHLLRPGWHRFEIVRRSEEAVEVIINGETAGTYPSRSAREAARLTLGDPSSRDGAGEAHWSQLSVVSVDGPLADRTDAWELHTTGDGVADQGTDGSYPRRAHLYLATDAESACEAEWGRVNMEVPYQFWCQVYVSEKPYQDFSVISPLNADGGPTDFAVLFDDTGAEDDSEASDHALVWVADAEGRHRAAAIARGAWHQLAIRRRTETAVDLLINEVPVGSFVSRSQRPVASYRFGDFSSQRNVGEAYWHRIRLVQVPKH